MNEPIHIIGFTGSLRRNSYNRAALRAAKELLPEGADLEIVDLSPLPFYNEEFEVEGMPQAIIDFKRKLSAADAILISTPEYNYSIPPVLKNALDCVSRGKDLPLSGKPLAIMSASIGMLGGARVQYHLRQVCVILNLLPLNRPEVFLANASSKFDQNGKLTDETSRALISNLLQSLVDQTRVLKNK